MRKGATEIFYNHFNLVNSLILSCFLSQYTHMYSTRACFFISCIFCTLCTREWHTRTGTSMRLISLGVCISVCCICISPDRSSEARVRPDLAHPPHSASHAWLGVWECVIRYHTSTKTCKDREGNPAREGKRVGVGSVQIWSDQINTAMQMGGKLKEVIYTSLSVL